jgi:2-dehydro-3-deoxyphosphogluconate aldolase/(4S)-4-hydroxy-2-oxoglutarate aldolase
VTATIDDRSILQHKILAILRAPTADCFVPMASVLFDAGIRQFEVTLTSDGALDALSDIRSHLGSDAILGVGTVRSTTDVAQARRAGAQFVVSPHIDGDVLEAARNDELPIFPGAFTPTEMQHAVALGASAVKLFPAGRLGAGYLRDIRGPFPDIAVVPTGGIALSAIPRWLAAGALAVGLGSPLQGDYHLTGDDDALRERGRAALAAVGSS